MAKVETERFFGKKGIIIMMRDGNKMVSAIFKDKKNADKYNRNNPADVKKLLQLAKKTKFPKAIDEDTDVGHQDDEPNMLKSTALEIMEYGKKLMDKLDKYDDMEGEVDFPNWWQSKLTLARDYVSKAYHYLDSEEKTSENIDRNFRTYADDEGDDEGPVDEGKKRYNVMYGVGSSKYTVNFHDGKSKHKDGSDFFDIAIFKNKRDLAKKINDLTKKGYIYSYKEGVNEDDMVFDPKTKSFKIKSGSMDWEKNFKWANDKELKVISKFIFMNPKGISGVIKMSKHKPFAFRRTIQKMAKKGLHERLYVPSAFDKALDRMKFNQFTPNNIKRLAKKFKVDYKDAVEFIKQNKVINVANKPTMAEASKEAMGIAGFTGTRGVAVDDFIKKNKIDARKLFNFVKKGNLRDRMDFVTAIAGKPNNKFHKMIVSRFAESVNEAFVVAYGKREGSKPLKPAFAAYADKKMAQKFMADMKRDGFKVMMTQKKIKGIDEDKKQIVQLKKKVGKKEIKFYDALSKLEKKMGKKKYRDFLVKSLKDFKVNGNHYDYRTNAAAEEKLFQLAK